MSSSLLASILPKPKHSGGAAATNGGGKSKWASLSDDERDDEDGALHVASTSKKGQKKAAAAALAAAKATGMKLNSLLVPGYGRRANNKNFIPGTNPKLDWGQDGGAYPEIHLAQYPLGMGLSKNLGANQTSTLALQTDGESGKIKYDLVLHQQGGNTTNSKKIIHSTLKDMTAQDQLADDDNTLPDEDEIQEITRKTREALEKVIGAKMENNDPHRKVSSAATGATKGPTFVKYVPSESSATSVNANGASSRIIRLSEAPVDPFEPSRFKHRKVPRAGGSPPPPVLRSPPRKVTAEEQKDWVIPPCISNWKNAKGYTIPLDKRLANDGRGLQDVTINDNFSKLSEALFIADRHAREEVKLRSELVTRVAEKEKQDKEARLRELAQKAREERSHFANGTAGGASDEEESSSEEEDEKMTDKEKKLLAERQALRREKAKEREREMRKKGTSGISNSGDRDISEKIALGLAQPTLSKDSMYDQRLFNQTSGISTGFSGGDDSYNLYDKPLFNSTSTNLYKPGRSSGTEGEAAVAGVDASQFEGLLANKGPHRGFAGTEASQSASSSGGPVQFEKEKDVFGMDAFISAAKRGRDGAGSKEDAVSKKSRH